MATTVLVKSAVTTRVMVMMPVLQIMIIAMILATTLMMTISTVSPD